MRDGVKIAIDVNLPRDPPAGARIPAVLIMARYWRSFEMRISQPGKVPMGPRPAIADFLVNHGYAVVTVDARGTGASFGTWQYPFSPEEIADYGQVVTWVTRQPWSDGTVGAVGFSYKGTTAELLTTTHPHAVKAVVPQELEFDLYTDTCLPGGILNACFMKLWDDTNHQLDANRFPFEIEHGGSQRGFSSRGCGRSMGSGDTHNSNRLSRSMGPIQTCTRRCKTSRTATTLLIHTMLPWTT